MCAASGRAVFRVILGAAAVAAIVVGWAVVKRARTAADPAARAGDAFYLIAAAGQGELEVVRNLLKEGIGVDSSLTENELRGRNLSDLDIVALPGTTALMAAAHSGNPEVVDVLLGAGADPNAARADGRTVLQAAVSGCNPHVVSNVLDAGAAVDQQGLRGKTALHIASRSCPMAVTMLLERGADPNAISSTNGETPLLEAVEGSQLETIEVLLAAGGDVNLPNPRTGETPLLRAADYAWLECVQILLHDRADLEARVQQTGMTALLVAVDAGNQPIVHPRCPIERPAHEVGNCAASADRRRPGLSLSRKSATSLHPQLSRPLATRHTRSLLPARF